MNRVLICGASSFVANGLFDLLTKSGFDVETFSRGENPSRCENHIRGKYLDIDQNNELSATYDVVINYAVLKDSSVEDNIKYLEALIKLCKSHQVKKLIHFSSIMVYNRNLQFINEDSPTDTSSNTILKGYGLIKIATDEYLNSVSKELPFEVIRARPGYVIAENRPCPFIKRLPLGISFILGNKQSTLPIVKREDIHKAILCIIHNEDNLPVYLFYPNDGMTKYQYAKKNVGGLIITLPKWIFKGIPHLLAKIHIIPWSLYSRFEGMFTDIQYSSELTENKLNMKFQ